MVSCNRVKKTKRKQNMPHVLDPELRAIIIGHAIEDKKTPLEKLTDQNNQLREALRQAMVDSGKIR
jgi:hypothetical protein